MAQLNEENVFKHIIKIRMSLLSQYTDTDCDSADTLLLDKILQDSVNGLAAELKLNTTSTLNKNLSNSFLKYAAEKFIYLNYCPSKLLCFLVDLLRSGTVREILLALSSVINTLGNHDKKKETTVNVFDSILNSLSQREFEKISTKGHFDVL